MVVIARLTLDPAFRTGTVDKRLFGSFAEHMGRCVYTGVFEPGHPTADDRGFRGDVLELVRELGTTVVRYPGGNFVSAYRWEDGVGPLDLRPRRLDLAWRSLEPNTFGVDEFAAWCEEAGVEPMMAVNLGTRGVQAAVDLLEYCNHPEGTSLSDQRRANGAKEPHDIRIWCLGNELDGPWQIGHKTADEYGRLAAETARALRRTDPRVELIACGSSNTRLPTFAAWEATVLEHCFDDVDHISLHHYADPESQSAADFLASGLSLDRAIDAVVATADSVAARRHSRKRIGIAVDEWNVWYQSRFHGESSLEWADAPRLIEDTYDAADAAAVGGLLMSLLRHADRVSIACQAQLVNVIAPIRTEPGGDAWRQTIFHPMALVAGLAGGEVLRVEPTGPVLASDTLGDVPMLDAVAVVGVDDSVSLLTLNRSPDETLDLEADLRAFPGRRVDLAVTLAGPQAGSADSDAPGPVPLANVEHRDGRLTARLAPASFSLVRLVPDGPPPTMSEED